MLKRYPSVVLVIALVCTLAGTPVFAQTLSNPEVKPLTLAIAEEPATPPENGVKANEKLRSRTIKLLSDAKAGKVAPATHSQTQPAASSNLSKRTKIAIGVGIAVAVVAIILIVNKPRLTGPVL